MARYQRQLDEYDWEVVPTPEGPILMKEFTPKYGATVRYVKTAYRPFKWTVYAEPDGLAIDDGFAFTELRAKTEVEEVVAARIFLDEKLEQAKRKKVRIHRRPNVKRHTRSK